jgi:hypothetical protein
MGGQFHRAALRRGAGATAAVGVNVLARAAGVPEFNWRDVQETGTIFDGNYTPRAGQLRINGRLAPHRKP